MSELDTEEERGLAAAVLGIDRGRFAQEDPGWRDALGPTEGSQEG